MTIEETYLKGCYVITPKLLRDSRGEFFESFNKEAFQEKTNIKIEFVQDNQSTSRKGVLRGLHLQVGQYAQAKLVRVVKGKALDVCVDLRKESETYGQYFSMILDETQKKQLFIPRGFAHGFISLAEDTVFCYKCDNYYNKASERGIIYNDSTLKINWNYPMSDIMVSEKDRHLPTFDYYAKKG